MKDDVEGSIKKKHVCKCGKAYASIIPLRLVSAHEGLLCDS